MTKKYIDWLKIKEAIEGNWFETNPKVIDEEIKEWQEQQERLEEYCKE